MGILEDYDAGCDATPVSCCWSGFGAAPFWNEPVMIAHFDLTEGNRFSFVMRKSMAGIRVEMKTSGTIDEKENVTAVMEASFGTSHIEGHKTSTGTP